MSNENKSEVTQYLTFKMDDEFFALDISQVHSVLDYEDVTKVPQMPDFMGGVINLRGNVIPIVDLKMKFGMPHREKTINTCIVIVEVDIDGDKAVLGALADSVAEVIDLDTAQIEPAPKIGTRLNTAFIKGMGKRGDDFIIILDLEQVFSSEELEMFASSGNTKSNSEKTVEAVEMVA